MTPEVSIPGLAKAGYNRSQLQTDSAMMHTRPPRGMTRRHFLEHLAGAAALAGARAFAETSLESGATAFAGMTRGLASPFPSHLPCLGRHPRRIYSPIIELDFDKRS